MKDVYAQMMENITPSRAPRNFMEQNEGDESAAHWIPHRDGHEWIYRKLPGKTISFCVCRTCGKLKSETEDNGPCIVDGAAETDEPPYEEDEIDE